MKTQCPNCKLIQDVPDVYSEKTVSCSDCGKGFTASEFKKPPIVVPRISFWSGFTIARLWAKCPKPYRSGFFATLGVITALIVSIYVYRYPFYNSKKLNYLEEIKVKLSKQDLFPLYLSPKDGILRGRRLREYKFVPDATRSHPYLSVWIDDREKITGLSVFWFGNKTGYPADINKDKAEFFRANAVSKGFFHLTGIDLTHLPDDMFEKDEFSPNDSTESYVTSHEQWHILISRTKSFVGGSDQHKRTCRSFNIDEGVYDFSVTAQNW